MRTDEQRQRFEAWAKLHTPLFTAVSTDGIHFMPACVDPRETAWKSWQESARQQSLIDYGFNLVPGIDATGV